MGQTSVFYFAFTNSHKPYGDNYSSRASRTRGYSDGRHDWDVVQQPQLAHARHRANYYNPHDNDAALKTNIPDGRLELIIRRGTRRIQ